MRARQLRRLRPSPVKLLPEEPVPPEELKNEKAESMELEDVDGPGSPPRKKWAHGICSRRRIQPSKRPSLRKLQL